MRRLRHGRRPSPRATVRSSSSADVVGALHRGRLRLPEIGAEPQEQSLRTLLPERDSLGRRLEPVERLDRRLTAPGRVGELLLGGVPLREERLQLLLRAPPRDPRGGLPLLRRLAACVGGGEVELRDPGSQPGNLLRELLGPLRCRGLQRERAQPLPHFCFDIARPLDLNRDPVQLQLGPVAALLELAEPGRLLHELPPLVRLGREHGFDLALADDGVHRAAEADVGEQLDEVGAANLCLVDEVLALAAAVQPPGDRDLREVELAEAAALVVEDELDLAALRGRPALRAVEENVVGLLGPQLRRGQRAGRPDDRVGDVRLAGAVRSDDHGDAGLELQLEGVRERLEAAQAN